MWVERNVRIATRDGVELSADVYRPHGESSHPTLLVRTPYDKTHNAMYMYATMIDIVDMVESGYVVVAQDCRGRFQSDGEWEPFIHEADDGFDTVEWIANQPWSNGRVGIYGNSYMGYTALAAATAAPPHLKAVYSYMGGSPDAGGWIHSNGAFELSFMFFWLTGGAWETLRRHGIDLHHDEQGAAAELRIGESLPRSVISHLPLAEIPGLSSSIVPFATEWLASADGSSAWREASVVARADGIRVPVLHITGLFDNFLPGHVELADRLAHHPDPTVSGEHRFILGPWDHEAYMSPRAARVGDVDFGPLAPNGYRLNSDLARKWFDKWLRGADDVDLPEPGVTYWDSGDWGHAKTWPPPHEQLSYFLRSGGDARTSNGDGGLEPSAASAESASYDEYSYDPNDPVPTTGGRTLSPALGVSGVIDQREVELREDVLVYTSVDLTSSVAVRGPVWLDLFVSSDREDTDFTAKLVDVHPDGYCENVAEGILRARYRNGTDHEEFLQPDEIVGLRIPLLDVSHDFGPGHKIRLEVSSSNFPRFDRNLNSRIEPAFGGVDDVRTARQRVYHDSGRPSKLTLPVVTARSAP